MKDKHQSSNTSAPSKASDGSVVADGLLALLRLAQQQLTALQELKTVMAATPPETQERYEVDAISYNVDFEGRGRLGLPSVGTIAARDRSALKRTPQDQVSQIPDTTEIWWYPQRQVISFKTPAHGEVIIPANRRGLRWFTIKQ